MAEYSYRFDGRGRGLSRTVTLDDADAAVGNIVKLDLGNGVAHYEIVDIESQPKLVSGSLNQRRRRPVAAPRLLVIRKVE